MFRDLLSHVSIRSNGHEFSVPAPREIVQNQQGVIFNYADSIFGRLGELLTNTKLRKFGASATTIQVPDNLPYVDVTRQHPEIVFIHTLGNNPAILVRTSHDSSLTRNLPFSYDAK